MRSRLGRLPGVISYTVNLEEDSAIGRYDPQQLTPAQIATALEQTGYPPTKVIPLK